MRIAIYPGSFNPIHRGHVQLAREVLHRQLADKLWMLVSPLNPLKMNSGLLDEQHRLAMTRLAVADEPGIIASDFEFSMPRPSYSIDTLQRLQTANPEVQFLLLIGSDNALVFDQWKDYRQILAQVEVLVYPRQGYPIDEALIKYPEMKGLTTPLYDISSTQLREMIKDGQSTAEWLPPLVEKYISENGFYT